jgi:hypothetical protein
MDSPKTVFNLEESEVQLKADLESFLEIEIAFFERILPITSSEGCNRASNEMLYARLLEARAAIDNPQYQLINLYRTQYIINQIKVSQELLHAHRFYDNWVDPNELSPKLKPAEVKTYIYNRLLCLFDEGRVMPKSQFNFEEYEGLLPNIPKDRLEFITKLFVESTGWTTSTKEQKHSLQFVVLLSVCNYELYKIFQNRFSENPARIGPSHIIAEIMREASKLFIGEGDENKPARQNLSKVLINGPFNLSPYNKDTKGVEIFWKQHFLSSKAKDLRTYLGVLSFFEHWFYAPEFSHYARSTLPIPAN